MLMNNKNNMLCKNCLLKLFWVTKLELSSGNLQIGIQIVMVNLEHMCGEIFTAL